MDTSELGNIGEDIKTNLRIADYIMLLASTLPQLSKMMSYSKSMWGTHFDIEHMSLERASPH